MSNNTTGPKLSANGHEESPAHAHNEVHRSHTVLVEAETKTGCYRFIKIKPIDFLTKVLAEFIGTAILLFLGCMGCVTGLLEGAHIAHAFHLNSILSFGFAVMLIIQIFGCISGAHLNPAVTVANYIYNLISLPLAAAYIVAQCLGAFIGFGVLKLLTPTNFTATEDYDGTCTTSVHPLVSPVQGFFVEFIITGILILTCCGVWDPRNAHNSDSVPLRFGFIVSCLSLVGGPYTGASMNPARSLAPAIWNGYFTHHWIYWVAPLSAAVIVSFLFKLVFRREVR